MSGTNPGQNQPPWPGSEPPYVPPTQQSPAGPHGGPPQQFGGYGQAPLPKKRPNHLLHGILTVVTCTLWAPVWIVLTARYWGVYSADTEAGIYLEDSKTFLEEINPGNAVRGVIVFDVPKSMKPTKIELHDSLFSGGVDVAL